MEEKGATKMADQPKQEPMPKAPADVSAPPEDAQKTASGLVSKVIQAGVGGAKPVVTSTVTVHYTGWTVDGKAFDSSVARGEPAKIPLKGVFAGWKEGLQLMTIGEERRFWVPEELAFKGQPGRPSGMLVFDVELLSFE
jgi:peptidylprolyl isomerase